MAQIAAIKLYLWMQNHHSLLSTHRLLALSNNVVSDVSAQTWHNTYEPSVITPSGPVQVGFLMEVDIKLCKLTRRRSIESSTVSADMIVTYKFSSVAFCVWLTRTLSPPMYKPGLYVSSARLEVQFEMSMMSNIVLPSYRWDWMKSEDSWAASR